MEVSIGCVVGHGLIFLRSRLQNSFHVFCAFYHDHAVEVVKVAFLALLLTIMCIKISETLLALVLCRVVKLVYLP